MAKLVTLKRQSGEAVYPVTVTAAVMDSEGNPAEVVFAKKNDSVSSKSSDQGVEVALGGTLASPTVKVNVTSSGITSDNNSVAIASDVFKYAAKNEVFKGAKAATSSSVAEAGKVGLVPAPASGATTKYLRSDGNWSDVDASKLEGLKSADFTRAVQGVQRTDDSNSPTYVLLARLPESSPSTFDSVHISGCFGDLIFPIKNTTNICVGRRGRLGAYGFYLKNNTFAELVVNTSGEVLLQCKYPYISYNFIITVQNATVHNTTNYTPLDTEFTYLYELQGVSCLDKNGVIEKAKSDANGSEIATTYVKKADTIKNTYGTDKGVKVELSGTFDEPKIDVTTTFGEVDIANSSYAVSGETIAKSVPLLIGALGKKIPKDADLNTFDYCEDTGTYICMVNTTASSLKNCPVKVAFIMTVESHSYPTTLNETFAYRIRKITTAHGDMYIQRVYTAGNAGSIVFQSWHRLIREDTTFQIATSSSVGIGGAVPAPQTEADNDKFLRGNGTWSAIPTSSVGSGIVLPATGNAVHEALTGTTYINTIGTDFIDNLFTAKG